MNNQMIMRDERQEVIHTSFTLNPFFHVQNGQLDKKYFCVFKMLRCLPQFLWLSLVCCIEGCGLFFFTLDCVTFVWIYIIIQLLSKKNIVIQSFFNYFNLFRCIFNFLLVIEVVSVKKKSKKPNGLKRCAAILFKKNAACILCLVVCHMANCFKWIINQNRETTVNDAIMQMILAGLPPIKPNEKRGAGGMHGRTAERK